LARSIFSARLKSGVWRFFRDPDAPEINRPLRRK
jgi:hypothetical protein